MNEELTPRFALLPALAMCLAAGGCFLGDYEIYVNNRSSFPAAISLDGQPRLTLTAGERGTITEVGRAAHVLEAELSTHAGPVRLEGQIPAVPEGALVYVCVVIFEGGITTVTAEDCEATTPPPPPTGAFSVLDRVAIDDTQFVTVTTDPPTLPGAPLELSIESTGTGGAVFASSGSTSLAIAGTTTFGVLGTQNSSARDDLAIVARYQGVEVARDRFTVRTWPRSMRRDQENQNTPSPGCHEFLYEVESESGDVRDLDGLILGEYVDYPGPGPLYEYRSPPYRTTMLVPSATDDPLIMQLVIGQTVLTPAAPRFRDVHEAPTMADCTTDQGAAFTRSLLTNEYSPDSFVAEQCYWFHDPVLMAPDHRQMLYGPMRLEREVVQVSPGQWEYIFRKFEPDRPLNPFVSGLTLP